jgi:hypothetical protein
MSRELIPYHEWRRLDPAGKLERLLGWSLDECLAILAIPVEDCGAVQMSAKVATIRAVLHACVKMGIKERDVTARREVIDRLMRGLADGPANQIEDPGGK